MMANPLNRELPLPEGYSMDQARRCVFAIENDNSTPGYRGLAWAVMLMAVHDGCCARWLREIAAGYALELPQGIFEKFPANRIKQKKGDHELMAVEVPNGPNRLVLSWEDGIASTPAPKGRAMA